MPMWWRRPAWRRVTTPVASTRSRRIRSWLIGVPAGRRGGFRAGGADGGGSGPVREGPVGPAVVVAGDERVEEALRVSDRGGLVGLGGQPSTVGSGPACRGAACTAENSPGPVDRSRRPSAATVRSTPFIGEASETFLRLGRAQQIALRSDIRSRERQNMQDLPLHR
jgi:hypothetical protein